MNDETPANRPLTVDDLDRLLGMMSHELRPPLMSSRLSASLMLDTTETTEHQQRLLQLIVDSSQRALDLVNEVLRTIRGMRSGIPQSDVGLAEGDQ